MDNMDRWVQSRCLEKNCMARSSTTGSNQIQYRVVILRSKYGHNFGRNTMSVAISTSIHQY